MRKNRIRRGGARGANFQGAADALDSLETHVCIGRVRGEGGDAHFEIEEGNVWVDCVIMPQEQPVTCRLSTIAGGPGNGVWMVPPDNAEVVIAFPGGDVTGGGIIIAVLPGAQLPEGVAEGKIVIVAPSVLVYSSSEGSAEPVITKSQFDAHTHPTGTGPSGPPDNAATSGTEVFKAQ